MRTLVLAGSVAPRDGSQLRWAGREHKAAARSRTLAGVGASPRDVVGSDSFFFSRMETIDTFCLLLRITIHIRFVYR
jgi:hypothetical protein